MKLLKFLLPGDTSVEEYFRYIKRLRNFITLLNSSDVISA